MNNLDNNMSAVLPVYNRNPLEIAYGKGPYLHTTDGKRYFDCVSGVAVNCLGHCPDVLIDALQQQAQKLWHVSNIFTVPGMDALAKEITAQTFADKVFFCNSGAEAVECAIKMVRKYHDATGNPDKYRIITFTGAFHGRTLAAIWASKRDTMMQEGFGPPVEGFDNIPFHDIEAVKQAITPETGAILIEPIQGDGGIRMCDPVYLKALRQLCDEHGLLLCFDEIQCGYGRTGSLFAHQKMGVIPDIMTSAKGIGGGFPLGACLANDKAATGMTLGTHGSTYGGNALAMAVGKVVIDTVNQPAFLANVNERGAQLRTGLEALATSYPNVIKEVRGVGLMQGLQTVGLSKDFIATLQTHHLVAPAAADNVVRLLPALNITSAHVEEILTAIESACKDLA
jgi:acetylornithine/N-succinyldiaminopimelate aminotransferase